jgi:hypothetical protein
MAELNQRGKKLSATFLSPFPVFTVRTALFLPFPVSAHFLHSESQASVLAMSPPGPDLRLHLVSVSVECARSADERRRWLSGSVRLGLPALADA